MYDGHQVPADDLRQLEQAAGGDTCAAILLTEPREIETVAEYVAEANAAQCADPKFVNELIEWFRFNRAEAERTGDGLYVACTGSRDLPRWLGKLIMRSRYSARARNDIDMKHIRSSAGIAVFVADRYTRGHWIDVGRHYERFALQATALGVRNAFINQPVEAAVVRAQFASWLGLHRRTPDLIVRFGYGPEMPWSRRRPVEQLLV